jgi:tRNA G18 (ribose-2'-O)-methylase SpoU
MAYIQEITDIHDPKLDVFFRMTEAQLYNRRSREKGLFIAESAKVIGHALDAGYEPVQLLVSQKHLTQPQTQAILARCGAASAYTAPDETLSALTGYALTRGMLCAMKRPPLKSLAQVCAVAHRLAVLEGVVDGTNIGAIFRSAAALGLDGVLLTHTCCDPLYRRAVRVSMGTVFQIPWTFIGDETHPWPEGGLAQLKDMGFATAAMALDDRSVPIDDPALGAQERLAILRGTEGDGLMPQTIAACDYTVRIPMAHGVDSLNVAAASAVAFWQLRRP